MEGEAYKLLRQRFGHPARTICYPYKGHDYGLCLDDFEGTGIYHVAMTLSADGTGTFFTVPSEDVEAINHVR